jgi:hypothetical protein
MAAFDDVLGTNYLPPTPVYPIDRLVDPAGATPPPNSNPASGGGVDAPLPLAGAVPQAAGQSGGLSPQHILGMLQPQPGGRFISSLGAGLSSAGQNWNKPAAAAFASGAGAALQGGQQWQNQLQDAKLKALHAALAAWKIGDMAAFRQQTANLRVLTQQRLAPSATASGAPAAAGSAPTNNPPAPAASVTGSSSGPTVYGNQAPPVAAPLPATVSTSAPRLTAQDALAQARDAIARGAPRDAVMQRLRDRDFDPSGL